MDWISSLDDRRVAGYRNLRDRTLRGEEIFLAEGRLVAERLLESRYAVESVFCAEALAEVFTRRLAGRIPLYVTTDATLRAVVGYPFHRGVLALGRRRPSQTLDELMRPLAAAETVRLVICPEITKPDNLGLIFRTAAGLGADGVVIGPRSCDPLSRRSLRVSMGGIFRVPFVESCNLAHDLARLQSEYRIELLATVLDAEAEPLGRFAWPARTGLLFGNEYEGLAAEWLLHCPRRLTIPMAAGTDSLNLGVAAGIFVYEMMRGAHTAPNWSREQLPPGGGKL